MVIPGSVRRAAGPHDAMLVCPDRRNYSGTNYHPVRENSMESKKHRQGRARNEEQGQTSKLNGQWLFEEETRAAEMESLS